MSGFWKAWMTVWCGATLAFGIVLALAAAPATDGAARLAYAAISSGPDGAAALDQPAMRFAVGLMGALTIGWSVTMFGMLRVAEAGGVAAWRWLTFAVLAWYVIDSALSVLTGFPRNAASNTVFLITYLIPILASGVLRASPPTRAVRA